MSFKRKEVVILELHNYTETVVREVVNDLLGKKEGICKCEKCCMDIMAIALNNLEPQYYVSEQGEVFTKLRTSYWETYTKVLTEVTKAIMRVEKKPLHES